MSHQSLKFFLVAIFAVGWTYGAAVPAVVVGEKREMPQGGPGGYSGYGSGYESSGGGYGGGSAPAQQQAPGYAMQPPMQQYGGTPPYTNPGFSVQTGIEGYLVSAKKTNCAKFVQKIICANTISLCPPCFQLAPML